MNYWQYLTIFLAVTITAILFTQIVRQLALRWKIVDWPSGGRKIHVDRIPLLGGLAIFFSFFIFLFILHPQILMGDLEARNWWGVFAGAVVIMIGGILDDKYNLKAKYQIIFPVIAIICVILGGVEIAKISNPQGQLIYLNKSFLFIGLSEIFLFIWLLAMTYTTKLLDGLDGLVSGLTFIGSLIIFLFTITTKYYQPDVGLAALILAGACLGFLALNWYPAKIFLGEGGSLLLGYLLGVLAIISGGKIAITLLVMALPVMDLLWTIIRRLMKGKHPFKAADNKHLHHRFLALGWSQKKAVLIFYSFAVIFGLAGLFSQSEGKFVLLVVLLFIMLLLVAFFSRWEKRQQRKKPKVILHICCAGCGVYVGGELLSHDYQVILYYCNSNIYSLEEYEKRYQEVKRVAAKFNLPTIKEEYDHGKWREMIVGYEAEPEGGRRCHLCYRNRLEATAKLAQEKDVKYFASTLTMSPHKDARVINDMAEKIAEQYNLEYVGDNFKKFHGTQRSACLSKKMSLYRQDYCGCEFSIRTKK